MGSVTVLADGHHLRTGSVTLHPIMVSVARGLTSGGRRQRLQHGSVLVVRRQHWHIAIMNTYLKFFGMVFVIAIVFGIVAALVTGTVHVKGMKEPICREDRPRDYWFVLGALAFIFAALLWLFLIL